MKRRMTLLTTAMIGLMSTTALTAAWADTAPTAAEIQYETQDRMLQTADEALLALTRVHAARLAIFDDRIDDASTLVSEARTALAEAEAGLLMDDPAQTQGSASYLPFDMSMALTEGFTPTEESRKALEEAYGLMQSAQADQAVEVLRLADIEINIQAALLPADQAMRLLDDASGYLTGGEYHSANLALREIENAVIVRSFAIDAIPVQGSSQ